MGDRRPVRSMQPWTWAGPSLLAKLPRPTENNSSADVVVDASALTAYSGYGNIIRLRSAEKLVLYHADNGGVVIIVHWRLYGLSGCVERAEPAVLLMSLIRNPCSETAPVHEGTEPTVPLNSRAKV